MPESYIQQKHKDDGFLDSGPYSADDYAKWTSAFFASTNELGSIRAGYLNEFAVSIAGSTATIGSGAAIVNGRPVEMSGDLDFIVPTPSVNPRIDIPVLCLNNTGIPRTAGIASGNNLIFPTDLSTYDNAASIPPYTVRRAILLGTESASPVAPTLDVDPDTLFMIPLYQYRISTVPAFDSFLDIRRFDSLSGTTLIRRLQGDDNINDNILIPQNYRNIRITYEVKMSSLASNTCMSKFRLNPGGALGTYTPNAYMAVDHAGAFTSGVRTLGDIRPNQQGQAWLQGEITFFNTSFVKSNFGYTAQTVQERFLVPAANTDSNFVHWGGRWFPATPTNINEINIQLGSTVTGTISSTDIEYAEVSIYGDK